LSELFRCKQVLAVTTWRDKFEAGLVGAVAAGAVAAVVVLAAVAAAVVSAAVVVAAAAVVSMAAVEDHGQPLVGLLLGLGRGVGSL
jgi:hypothetical protein